MLLSAEKMRDNETPSPTKRDQYLQNQKIKYTRQRDISKTKKLIRGYALNVSNILGKIVSDTDKLMRKLYKADTKRRMKLRAFLQWKQETKFSRRHSPLRSKDNTGTSLVNELDVKLIMSDLFESPSTKSVHHPPSSGSPHYKSKPTNSRKNLKSPPQLLIEKIMYHGPYDFGSYSSRQLASKSSDSNLILSHAQAVAQPHRRRSPHKSSVKVSPAPPRLIAVFVDDDIATTSPTSKPRDDGGLSSVHIPMTHAFKVNSDGKEPPARDQMNPPQLSIVGGDFAFSLCSGSINSAPRREARLIK